MKRSGVMLCYPFEEKRLSRWKPPYIVQPKLDGERCRAVYSGKNNYGWQLWSSECNEFISVSHINSALQDQIPHNYELDGELYCHGMDFSDIHSRVSRTVNLHEDFKDISLYIFDLVANFNQMLRLGRLVSLDLKPPLIVVPIEVANSLDEIMKIYDKFLEMGYEGIVVRHLAAPYIRKRSIYMMKFKPKKDDYYEIVGFLEEYTIKGDPKGVLGRLICRGNDGTNFPVYSGFSDDMRYNLWQERDTLIGKTCHVYYQHLFPNSNRPRNATVMKDKGPIILDVIEKVGLSTAFNG